MAYVSLETITRIKSGVKDWCKRWNIKATVKKQHFSTVIVTIREGAFRCDTDLSMLSSFYKRIRNDERILLDIMDQTDLKMWEELEDIIMSGNHNNSDIMSDYYDVGWYAYVHIGEYNKPYFQRNSISFCTCGLALVNDKCPEHGKNIDDLSFVA